MLHAISPGDTTIEAPGACVIAPKIEPLSELLKYKLLFVSVGSINVDLCEEESDLLLQVMRTFLLLHCTQCIMVISDLVFHLPIFLTSA